MDILKVDIKNFLSIREAKINLKDQGLVLIQGVNEDDSSANSNGVGKSSIADALCWALYGTTARGVSGDQVVENKISKKDCRVAVSIQDGASQYIIERYRKDKTYKNSTRVLTIAHGTTLDLSKGTEKETQELINGIMGCSYEVFMAAIYAGQEVTPDLPKMTDKQLKMLIEEAAGVDRLEKAYEIAKGKAGVVKANLATVVYSLDGNVKHLHDAKVDLERSKIRSDEFETGRKERHDVFKNNAGAHRAQILTVGGQIKAMGYADLSLKFQTVTDALNAHGAKLEKRDEIKARLADVQRKHDRAALSLAQATDAAKKHKGALDNAEEAVRKPCGACGKPGNEADLDQFKTHVKSHLTDALIKARSCREDEATLAASISVVVDELVAYSATLPDVSDLTRESAALTVELQKIADLKVTLKRSKDQYDRQNELAAAALTEANPEASAVDLLKKRIEGIEVEVGKLTSRRLELEGEQEIANNVVKVFSPAGVRAHILDTVTPFLNDRTSDYLSALSDGNITAVWTTLSKTAKGDTKEKFNIEVSNDEGSESFGGLSGGEKRKVRLATMLALQDLVSSRATKPINIWIGDEIDDALDKAGLERLMGILERKARERGTVLVVSHSDLRDWIDNVITVTKRGKTSTVEGVSCEA